MATPLAASTANERSVLSWPRSHFALQLIALESRAAADEFAGTLDEPLLRVQVESGGRILYAVLLGDYPSAMEAATASIRFSELVPSLEPWVRPVGPLQDAVRRASGVLQ